MPLSWRHDRPHPAEPYRAQPQCRAPQDCHGLGPAAGDDPGGERGLRRRDPARLGRSAALLRHRRDVNPPSVFDHTALVALFDAHPKALDLWRLADQGVTQLVMPAAAVAEANHLIGATHNAWSALLFPADVTVAPLDSAQAVDTGRRAGALAVRQVVHEAQAVVGGLITPAPWQYRHDEVPPRGI